MRLEYVLQMVLQYPVNGPFSGAAFFKLSFSPPPPTTDGACTWGRGRHSVAVESGGGVAAVCEGVATVYIRGIGEVGIVPRHNFPHPRSHCPPTPTLVSLPHRRCVGRRAKTLLFSDNSPEGVVGGGGVPRGWGSPG